MPDPAEVQQRFTGAKLPLKPMHVWGIRVRLQVEGRIRDLALFDLAIDSKLRACDLVALRVSDLLTGASVRRRGVVLQQKTSRSTLASQAIAPTWTATATGSLASPIAGCSYWRFALRRLGVESGHWRLARSA